MAYVQQTHRTGDFLERALSAGAALLDQAATAYAQHRAYKKTVRELSKLTSRELDDLGISRSNIRWIAWASARGLPVR